MSNITIPKIFSLTKEKAQKLEQLKEKNPNVDFFFLNKKIAIIFYLTLDH